MSIHPIETRYGREEVKNSITSFQNWAKKEFKQNLTSIVLFGSFAKKTYDFSLGSDIDILLILRRSPIKVKSQIDLFQPIILEILRKYHLRISPIAVSEKDFEEMVKMKFPLALGILESYETLYDSKNFFTENIKNLSSSMKNIKIVEESVWYSPSLEVTASS